jgi:hypothetical protein
MGMATSTASTTDLVHAYYAAWQHGSTAFDEARLRTMLAADLRFEGPIAGTRIGVDSFVRGLADFVRSLKALRMVQLIHTASAASAVYDCDLGPSGGTLRLAEFLQLEGERIQAVRLVFDPARFKALTA